jgi:hypothetical protein
MTAFVAVLALGALVPLGLATSAQALTPLAPPTDVWVSTQADVPLAIFLHWTDPTPHDPDSETSFEIWRCAGVGCADFAYAFSVDSPISAYGASDYFLAEHATYTYRVRAARGTEVSGWSNVVSATTGYVFPQNPSGFTATYVGADRRGNNGNVLLAWTDAATAEASYLVFRCQLTDCGNTQATWSLPANSTSFTDDTVADGIEYIYYVAAVGAGGAPYTAYSPSLSVRPGVGLAQPTSFTATNTSRGVALKWRSEARTGTLQISRCEAMYCRDITGQIFDVGPWIPAASLPARASNYLDRTAAPGTSYIYRIRIYTPAMASWFVYTSVTTP